jgi:glycosyltransferase involved in cell wall biosynthesis
MRISIAGTRGIPARHGGFETFAQELAQHLASSGDDVAVYCQAESPSGFRDRWNGIRRIGFSGLVGGALGTVIFDFRCIVHVIKARPDVVLTLGYNTAVFCLLLRLFGIRNVINMDGIEWRRDKWGVVAKAWFRFNEWAGAKLGNWLVADHPEIKAHLSRHGVSEKTTVIPYGAHAPRSVDPAVLLPLGVEPDSFFCVIARPEPENSVREIVRAFVARRRGMKLLILGHFDAQNAYHQSVMSSANDEVIFAGAIYESDLLAAIRMNSIAYVHGHTVGGTNPSLVEALGAGCTVVAHRNPYNEWVAGDSAVYFGTEVELDRVFSNLCDDDALRVRLRSAARRISEERFQWPQILAAYHRVLSAQSRKVPQVGSTAGDVW